MGYFIPKPTEFSTIPDYSSYPGVSGYNLSITGTTTFQLTPGYARAFGSDFGIQYSGTSPGSTNVLLGDVAQLGAGGCWPVPMSSLTLTNDTVFGVYLISKSSGTTGGSLNPSVRTSVVVATGNNFLPPGYDVFRRIGLVDIAAGTTNILPWDQTGNGNDRSYVAYTQKHKLNSGSATTFTQFSLTTGSGFIPPKPNITVFLTAYMTVTTAGTGFNISFTAASAGLIPPIYIHSPVVTQQLAVPFTTNAAQDPTSGESILFYQSTNAGNVLGIDSSGFIDSLGNDLF